MAWIGTWRNQFGSVLRIIRDAEGRIEGNFRTLSSRPRPYEGFMRRL